MSLKTLSFHFTENGSVDCWVQEDGGPLQSFDPVQLPGKAESLLGKVLTAALVARAEADARVESVVHLLDVKAELEAKDANIQTLIAELESLKR